MDGMAIHQVSLSFGGKRVSETMWRGERLAFSHESCTNSPLIFAGTQSQKSQNHPTHLFRGLTAIESDHLLYSL